MKTIFQDRAYTGTIKRNILKNISRRFINIWKLNNILLDNTWVKFFKNEDNITHYQRNANQNNYEVPFHTSQNGCDPKVYK